MFLPTLSLTFKDLLQNEVSFRNDQISSENREWATKEYVEHTSRSPERFAAEIWTLQERDYFVKGLKK